MSHVPQAQFSDRWKTGCLALLAACLTILLFYPPRNFVTNPDKTAARERSVYNFDIKGVSVSTQKVWCALDLVELI